MLMREFLRGPPRAVRSGPGRSITAWKGSMSDDPFVTKLGLTPPQAAILNRLADATADARELTETRGGVERVYLRFKRNDGGRAAAGYKGSTGDCGVRARGRR